MNKLMSIAIFSGFCSLFSSYATADVANHEYRMYDIAKNIAVNYPEQKWAIPAHQQMLVFPIIQDMKHQPTREIVVQSSTHQTTGSTSTQKLQPSDSMNPSLLLNTSSAIQETVTSTSPKLAVETKNTTLKIPLQSNHLQFFSDYGSSIELALYCPSHELKQNKKGDFMLFLNRTKLSETAQQQLTKQGAITSADYQNHQDVLKNLTCAKDLHPTLDDMLIVFLDSTQAERHTTTKQNKHQYGWTAVPFPLQIVFGDE